MNISLIFNTEATTIKKVRDFEFSETLQETTYKFKYVVITTGQTNKANMTTLKVSKPSKVSLCAEYKKL